MTTAAQEATPTESAPVATVEATQTTPVVEKSTIKTNETYETAKEETPAEVKETPAPKSYDWVLKKYSGEFAPEEFDVEDYAKKISTAHANLEKKLGKKGAMAPETIDEYDYQPKYELSQTFREKALNEGKLSKDQYKWVAEQYEALIDQATPTAERTQEAMKERWGDNYESNAKSAVRAYEAFVPSHISLDEIGNNPVVLDILAHIGRELGEDVSIKKAVQQAPRYTKQDIDAMRNEPDYWSPEKQKIVSDWYKANAKR